MERFKNIMRAEADIEIYSCTYDISMLFVYGFLLWIQGKDALTFETLFVMMILGYAAAWTQRALFLKEREYKGAEEWIRKLCWVVLPVAETFFTGRFFHWYDGTEAWTEAAFLFIMFLCYLLLWLFMRWIYADDTKELNGLLRRMQDNMQS